MLKYTSSVECICCGVSFSRQEVERLYEHVHSIEHYEASVLYCTQREVGIRDTANVVYMWAIFYSISVSNSCTICIVSSTRIYYRHIFIFVYDFCSVTKDISLLIDPKSLSQRKLLRFNGEGRAMPFPVRKHLKVAFLISSLSLLQIVLFFNKERLSFFQ